MSHARCRDTWRASCRRYVRASGGTNSSRSNARRALLVSAMTQRVSQQIQAEVAEVGAEVVRARLVVPWLAGVPVIALLLVAQWPAFHHLPLVPSRRRT